MSWGWEINLGHVITLALAIIGLIGGYVTLRVKAAENEGDLRKLEMRVDAYGTALADLRFHVEAVCVKKDDLERLDDRIGKRMDALDLQIRSTSDKIIALISSSAGRSRSRPEP